MAKQQRQKASAPQQPVSSAPIPLLQPRAFSAIEQPAIAESPQAEIQSKQDGAALGHSLGRINTRPLSHLPIQPKLTIGQVGDPYEQEADRVAAQVVSRIHAPESQAAASPKLQSKAALRRKSLGQSIQRLEAPEEDELQMKPLATSIQRQEMPEEELQMKPAIQRRADVGGMTASNGLESSINQARGGGQAMSDSIRQPMEQAFGADFSNVRVHTDSQSDQLSRSINAQAFTTKNDIFFSKGTYNPGDRGGQELLAHELTHVVQQGGAAVQRQSNPISKAAPKISRSPAPTIQRVPMSIKDFDTKIKAHWPLKGNTLAGLRDKLMHFHKSSRFLTLDQQIDQLKDITTIADRWRINDFNYEKGKQNNPKTSEGLYELAESLGKEVKRIELLKETQGSNNQASSDIEAEVKDIYTQKIYAPICAAISRKLGLGRCQKLRSNQLNAFRQKLKDAARSQAYMDIDAVAGEVMASEGKEESEAMQHYYATKAKAKARTESKEFVNKVVQDLAVDITKAAVPENGTCFILKEVAQQAADKYKNPTIAMESQAKAIVKQQVGRTKGADAGDAIKATREITKGSLKDEGSQELSKKIKDDIHADGKREFAKTTLKTVIQSDTLDKGFQTLGKVVDLAVPSPGSSCEVDIQLKVPIGHSGAYFTTRVLGAAEKDSEEGKQEVEAKLDVSAGLGWSALGIIDASVQAGLFFKSKAETSQKALQQVSYAFYRKLQTENKDSRVANAIWGMKGADKVQNSQGRNMTQGESAEIWAAAMEEQLFYERDSTGKIVKDAQGNKQRNESSVEVGWLVGGQAEVNAGGAAKVEGEAKYKRGTRYSAESLDSSLGKHDKTRDELRQAGAGQSRNTIELKSEVEIKALSGFGCGLEGSISFNSNGVYEFEIEAFAKANTQWGEDKTAWQTALAAIGAPVGDLVKKLVNAAAGSKETFVDKHGALADVAFTTADLDDKFSDSGKTLGGDLANATPDVEDGVTGEKGKALEAKQSFKLAAKYSAERTNTKDPFAQALEVSISRVRELGYELDTGNVGLKAKMETAEKLVRVKLGWGKEKKFQGNFLGVGNIGNQGK